MRKFFNLYDNWKFYAQQKLQFAGMRNGSSTICFLMITIWSGGFEETVEGRILKGFLIPFYPSLRFLRKIQIPCNPIGS